MRLNSFTREGLGFVSNKHAITYTQDKERIGYKHPDSSQSHHKDEI